MFWFGFSWYLILMGLNQLVDSIAWMFQLLDCMKRLKIYRILNWILLQKYLVCSTAQKNLYDMVMFRLLSIDN